MARNYLLQFALCVAGVLSVAAFVHCCGAGVDVGAVAVAVAAED
jgi:hypothetical protein